MASRAAAGRGNLALLGRLGALKVTRLRGPAAAITGDGPTLASVTVAGVINLRRPLSRTDRALVPTGQLALKTILF